MLYIILLVILFRLYLFLQFVVLSLPSLRSPVRFSPGSLGWWRLRTTVSLVLLWLTSDPVSGEAASVPTLTQALQLVAPVVLQLPRHYIGDSGGIKIHALQFVCRWFEIQALQ